MAGGSGSPTVFLSPIEDAVSLLAVLVQWAGHRVRPDREAAPRDRAPALRDVLKEYHQSYRAPRKRFDGYFRALADDPLAALAWYGSHLPRVLREPKRLPSTMGAGSRAPFGVARQVNPAAAMSRRPAERGPG